MRSLFLFLALWCAVATTRGADIGQVLDQSQRHRLVQLDRPATDPARVAIVRSTFDRLRRAANLGADVELRVVSGPVPAETLMGRIVIANELLADMPEGERMFLLAHEIGHVALGHWGRLEGLYRRHLPGELARDQTDAAAPALGREASALAHEMELQSDAYAMRMLTDMHYGADSAMAVFLRQGVQHDTATHPGTRKRVAHLRMIGP
jgi:Zn-dependent protease with chaperone function